MAEVIVTRDNRSKKVMQSLDPITRNVLVDVGSGFAKEVTQKLISANKLSSTASTPIVVTPAYKIMGGWAVKIGPALPWLFFVHSGRRPGAKMPPSSIIRDWASRKGFDNPDKVAFPIARSIGINGIPPYPFLTLAFERRHQQMVTEIREKVKNLLLIGISNSGG
jgi:hypothetical protein